LLEEKMVDNYDKIPLSRYINNKKQNKLHYIFVEAICEDKSKVIFDGKNYMDFAFMCLEKDFKVQQILPLLIQKRFAV